MPYSTGRGGAGNFHSAGESSKVISPSNSSNDAQNGHPQPQPHSKHDNKHYVSTGRGGAGNITTSEDAPSPKLVPQGSNTPQLHTNKVTTGRGGYGNMVSNDNPELTRKLQDVEHQVSPKENELYTQASNRSFSVGRGGFGNVISHTKSGTSQRSGGSNDPPNLMAVTSRGKKRVDHKKGFMSKIKEIFS
ncbi:hypothetical protein PGUG_02668 [Meyerozyma guilliermondii ATCC 6260]|uniref:Protein PAR32 n=1 Tax=Meyerozyma guilliermondii (strain ATCC 6260 / CBS 566 / DSM 6381 / JCM 1539 / NBRC 10279 / NRRL Y-324) TaxID=294746 RepID=A5DHB7_PICGU|nr:uncharacterized protein PGUG_02668 [Meyerozyma guilliermondii ATCC 6260]EDK38570.2 hypothetical protein PGUG_02668 [Meyerozyma guilliermondii ATCC 6260]